MKFLVVDDAKLARRMTIKSLKSVIFQEFDLIEATNGKEAIEFYKKYHPEVCFMDLTMPEVDGFEATKEICTYDQNARIIIVSADVQTHAIEKAKECGAIGFIKKPVDADSLKQMIEQLEILK